MQGKDQLKPRKSAALRQLRVAPFLCYLPGNVDICQNCNEIIIKKSIGFDLFTGCPHGSATQARWSHFAISSHAEHAASNSSIDPKPSNKFVVAVSILRTHAWPG